MKYLFVVAAALLSCATHASDPAWIIASVTNGAGGYITFTNRHTQGCTGDWSLATTSTDKGSLNGCWKALDNGLSVAWEDGDSRFYPYANINFSDWFLEYMRNQNRTTPRVTPGKLDTRS